jgi:hypothetical protein
MLLSYRCILPLPTTLSQISKHRRPTRQVSVSPDGVFNGYATGTAMLDSRDCLQSPDSRLVRYPEHCIFFVVGLQYSESK